jgi:hypothetical protein
MAINVNTVYQTVLLILNKEQRGYMTPVEFNKIGTQVQLEIFERYFEDLNQQIRIPQTDTDYADRVVNLDEKISIFKTIGTATYTNNAFTLPIESGAPQSTQTFTTVNGQAAYTFTTITANQLASGTTTVYFNGIAKTVGVDYNIAGTTLTLIVTPGVTAFNVFVTTVQDDFYRLGTVLYSSGALPIQELERVDRGELYHLLSSNLTAPTTTYPIYVYERKQLFVYPQTIQSGIQATYIRKPLDPMWNFTYSGNAYVYDPNTSIDFDLHDSEQIEIILKVLLYAGVIIKSPEIIQVAAQQVAQEQNNQKS